MEISKPLRRSDVLVESANDETLLYDPVTRMVYVLNSTARLIWDLCDQQHDIEEMAIALQQRFTVPADCDLRGDIEQILAEISQQGLLQPTAT